MWFHLQKEKAQASCPGLEEHTWAYWIRIYLGQQTLADQFSPALLDVYPVGCLLSRGVR